MQKIFDTGEKLFFNTLIICLISCIYFNILPKNTIILMIGFIFCILYFGINFCTGYKNSLTIVEAFVVGIMGCGVGLFLGAFALYTNFILNSTDTAIWMVMPYFSPTISIIQRFSIEVTFAYPFILMALNIVLVIAGSFSKKLMNKLNI